MADKAARWDTEEERKMPLSAVIGMPGLKRAAGWVYEEQHPKLRNKNEAIKIYSEMRDNSPILGACLFAIELFLRSATWNVVPGTPAREDQQLGEFFTGCMDDMSHTWADLISEILSMCVFGWSYFEICYKLRQGPGDDPTRRSQFTDGKVGLRKVEIRSQESWDDWAWDDEGGVKGMYQRPPEDYARRFIPIQKALLFRTRTTKNNPEGRSLLRNAVVDYFYSKQLQKIEAIGAERDLAGLPVLQVPARLLQPTVSAEDYALITELKKQMSELKRDERDCLLIPPEMDEDGKSTGYKFTLQAAAGSRQFDINTIIVRHDQRMAMSVLAQFLLLGMDKVGSYALSTNESDIFIKALAAILDSIAAVFNRHLIPRVLELNGWRPEKPPRLEYSNLIQVSLKDMGETLRALGVPLGENQVNDVLKRLGLTPMEPGEMDAYRRPVDEPPAEDGDDEDGQDEGEDAAGEDEGGGKHTDAKDAKDAKDAEDADPKADDEKMDGKKRGGKNPKPPRQ